MKSKAQKQEELKKATELLGKSNFLVFTDFNNVKAEKLRSLRRELKNSDSYFLVIKKRLLSLLFKEKGINFDTRGTKLALGTVFSPDIEKSSSAVLKFLTDLAEGDRTKMGENLKKVLAGYDIKTGEQIEASKIIFIGQLPPREVLLAQLLGMISAPIKSLLYLLDQKAKSANK